MCRLLTNIQLLWISIIIIITVIVTVGMGWGGFKTVGAPGQDIFRGDVSEAPFGGVDYNSVI